MKLLLSLLTLFSLAFAMENKLPDCYDMAGLKLTPKPLKKEIFVVLDQTTIMNSSIQGYVFKSTKKFLKAGNAINIITYSSNQGNRFTQVPFSGVLNSKLTPKERNYISKKRLRKFDSCMKKQHAVASNRIYKALKEGFANSSSNIPNSDIFLNLYQIVQNGIAPSQAQEKIMIISSDMLENSTISSFYGHGTLKALDVKKEFAKYKESELESDYANTRVFVVGAGVTSKKSYNDPKKMHRLSNFWRKYFQYNNANLVEFGEPIPLNPAY